MKLFLYVMLVLALLLGLAACGGGQETAKNTGGAPLQPGDAEAGQGLFVANCSACHGPAGQGVPGLGKDMTTSEFIAGKSDEELVAFIAKGRDPSDPLNTTGVAMPPRGGNPGLTDQDLMNIVAYIRTIHK